MIAIILPTVTGREASLERAKNSFEAHTSFPNDIIVIKDEDTCGLAWRKAAENLHPHMYDYIYYGADDVEATPDWDEPLREACDRGFCPTSVIERPDGTIESVGLRAFTTNVPPVLEDWMPVDDVTTPFMSSATYEAIPPMIPLHYCTDMWHSHCCRQLGQPVVARIGSRLIHHSEDIGRLNRGPLDTSFYHKYVSGEWKP